MKNQHIQLMLQKSIVRLKSAKILLKAGNYADSISRSYYAVLDVARAVLVTDKIYPKSHAGTIAKFNQHYIKTKIFPNRFGTMLASIEKARTKADYAFEVSFTKQDAQEKLRQAEEFVEGITKYLSKRLNVKN